MEMEKKNLAIIILAVVLAASGVGNIFLAMQAGLLQVTPPPLDQSLVFATIAGPTDMDPHMCYDTAGGDVISQIAECLYKFDTTDPSYPLLPVLATALPTVTGGGTELTIPLRQGVLFQDGTAFNSTVAKWNFDRLNYFMNISGNKFLDAPFNVPLLPSQQIAKHAALFTIAGMTIVNKTEIIDTYTIKITMNLEKASFVNLLNYEATSMQSMISARQQGKQFEILTYADDDVLIGTGPFKFQNYFTDIQVKFVRNEDYWGGAPTLTNVTMWIIEDDIALNTAVLAGDIDLYDAPKPEFHNQFRNDPDITLLEAGPTLNINYMGFNGYMVDTPIRKAISYAINYSYIIDVILLGEAYRLLSPIPTGIPLSNYGFNVATFDRTIARQTMVAEGYGDMGWTDAQWQAADFFPGYNITAQSEGTTRRDIALYVSDNLDYIGINAPVVQISFWDIISCMEHDTGPLRRSLIPMYMLGWAPDYIDPENYITPLYSNTSAIWVNTWDYQLEKWMLLGETTPDPIARQAIYDNIQQKLVEELYFFVWFTSGKNYDVYQDYVHGWVPNAIARLDLYEVYLA
jgi:ABC-type transport system substrate-binding protein